MSAKMKRRAFITLLGGAAAVWPLFHALAPWATPVRRDVTDTFAVLSRIGGRG